MTQNAQLRIVGGPSKSVSRWNRVKKHVSEQVGRLLKHLEMSGDFILEATEARKGGSHHQGLSVQRYDSSDVHRPAVMLLAQPFGNETCWLWRLQLPRDTNASLTFSRMSVAVEEGWHMTDDRPELETTSNVVPLHPSRDSENLDAGDKSSTPTSGMSDLLNDQRTLAYLLKVLGDKMKESPGDEITVAVTSEILRAELGAVHHPKNSLGPLLSLFTRRKFLQKDRERNMYTVTEKGIAFIREQGGSVRSEAEIPSPAVEPAREQDRASVDAPPKPVPTPPPVEVVAPRAPAPPQRQWEDEETPQQRRDSERRLQVIMQTHANVIKMMRYILARSEWSDAELLMRRFALDAIEEALGNRFSRRDAGRILATFFKREYFLHNKADDLLEVTKKGRSFVSGGTMQVPTVNPVFVAKTQQKKVEPVQPTATSEVANIAPASQPTPQVAPALPAKNIEALVSEHLKALGERARAYEAAKIFQENFANLALELDAKIAEVEASQKQLLDEKEQMFAKQKAALKILNDPSYAQASEERKKALSDLGIS